MPQWIFNMLTFYKECRGSIIVLGQFLLFPGQNENNDVLYQNLKISNPFQPLLHSNHNLQ